MFPGNHTFYRKEPVSDASTHMLSEHTAHNRFGEDILPSSFDKLPYFAGLVQPIIKKCLGSKSTEQQALILLSLFSKLRWHSGGKPSNSMKKGDK